MKGFTLVEAIVVIFIVLIIAGIFFPIIKYGVSGHSFSNGLNGIVETRCIEGYKFIISSRGVSTQLMDSQGRGVQCFESTR